MRYMVLTWDENRERFTPQRGVCYGPYTLWGLRVALRKLRDMGYDGRPVSDPSIKVVPYVRRRSLARRKLRHGRRA